MCIALWYDYYTGPATMARRTLRWAREYSLALASFVAFVIL